LLIAWIIAQGFQNTALAQPTLITINGPDTVCLSSTSNYYVAPTTGITYSWTVSTPNTVMSTTATGATVLWNALGAQTLTATGKDALNLNVAYPNTSCTIGTGIGPAVPFSAFFSMPGAYPLTLNFTTLSIPPPATATIMVRYYVTNHGVTQECYDTLQLALPDCSGQWPPQRQSQSNTQAGSADGMMVYPNPASHTVGVSYNFGTAASGDAARRIAVYDMMGRPVYTASVHEAIGNLSIPVESLAAAVYIVRMEQNGRTVHTQRLSITH
jgi:hypothetical protein